MKIIWRFLRQRPDLKDLEQQPLTPGVEQGPQLGDRRDSYQRRIAVETPGPPEPEGAFRRVRNAILAYRIFPPALVSGVLRRAPLEVGDTYGICYHFLPGIDFFFGGRVIATFDGPEDDVWKAGFTLQTIQGHPEVGEETFWVEKDLASGVIHAGLRSWSRPGLWLTRLVAPLTRWIQVRACYAALTQLEKVARRTPSAPRASGLVPLVLEAPPTQRDKPAGSRANR